MVDQDPPALGAKDIPSPSSQDANTLPTLRGSPSRRVISQRLGSPTPSHGFGTPPVRQVPTPSQLGTEQNSNTDTPLPGASLNKSSLPGPGESALSAALQESFRDGNTRSQTPPARPLSPASGADEPRASRSNYGSFDHRRASSTVPFEDVGTVRRHLAGPAFGSPSNAHLFLQREDRSRRGSGSRGRAPEPAPGLDEDEFSSLRLQGGDVTRNIYRWTEQQEAEARTKRSKSFNLGKTQAEDDETDINILKQPGGFRRNYIRRSAMSPSPNRAGPGASRGQPPQLFTSNFIEFLSLYGHFAGEDLEDDEEGDDEFSSGSPYGERDLGDDEPGEETALLRRQRKRGRRKDRKARGATATGAAMMLLKSFVGTGVLFLPKAFLNGGMLFSTLVLLFVSALSYYCFILLVTTRIQHTYSFGDMGAKLYGPWLRGLINASLIISQIGFSSAYIVFVSENLQAFVLAVTDCRTFIPVAYFILMQMIIFMPLSLYRNIARIQNIAIVADVFIVLGLVYLFYFDILTISANEGMADVRWFNAKSWTLFIGTAIFTFEGIGLIIPIQESMRDQRKLPLVLFLVMIVITVIFTVSGILSYAAYGSKTKTVILLNMPQDNKFVNAVQFIYSLAILLSTPLQFHPVIDITSKIIFKRTGKNNPLVKWIKNVYRFSMVCLCALIAWAGANDLDKFVSLVGSFACIPLVYIYPPMLHYRGVSRTPWQRLADLALIAFGFVGMVYTTGMTVRGWASGGGEKTPGYCDTRGKR